MNTVYQGGPLLIRAKIVLIFRGSGWTGGTPSWIETISALAAVLASPYMSGLVQYRGIRRAEIIRATTDPRDIGSLGADPRGFLKEDVWRVSNDEIMDIVRAAVAERPPPDTEDTFYLVGISQNPLPVFSDANTSGAAGYHSQFKEDGRTVTYGAVLNWSANSVDNVWQSNGSLPSMLLHELVEACTNPDVSTGYHFDNGEEICDLGSVSIIQFPNFSRKLSVAEYWSDLAGKVVAPTSYSVRVAIGKRATDSIPSLRLALGSPSVRGAVLAGFNP